MSLDKTFRNSFLLNFATQSRSARLKRFPSPQRQRDPVCQQSIKPSSSSSSILTATAVKTGLLMSTGSKARLCHRCLPDSPRRFQHSFRAHLHFSLSLSLSLLTFSLSLSLSRVLSFLACIHTPPRPYIRTHPHVHTHTHTHAQYYTHAHSPSFVSHG